MKLNVTPRAAVRDPDLQRELREHARQVNSLSEGLIAAVDNAAASAPTTGDHLQGDTIRNIAPAELGIIGSKYVIWQFVCVASGTPGTWVGCRALTGN
ncbi:MAG: hypothetical protein EOO23_01715 [Comamonadaceae bacterium]|nr:MAG: hypothetical protein EOO23_01715 [Comamonadaceae bacterium]